MHRRYARRVVHAISAAHSGRFEHQLQSLRDQRDEDALIAQAIEALTAAGVAVIDRPRWTDDTVDLESLVANVDDVTEESHASCPGHAAYVESLIDDRHGDERLVVETTYVCTDPVAYGHFEAEQEPASRPKPSTNEVFSPRSTGWARIE